MYNFASLHNLFQLTLPEGWNQHFSDNIYTFFNESEVEGVLQISSYFKKKGEEFNLHEELLKEQKEYPEAQQCNISSYNAIHYCIQNTSDKTLQYFWVIGYKNIKLFVALLLIQNKMKMH